MSDKRNITLDVLRILSAFFVVMIHVSTEYLMKFDVNTSEFVRADVYDCISRFSVPMFAMISGALFLSKEGKMDIKKLWIHNILRIIIIFFVWGFAYYAFQSIYFWKFDFLHQGPVRTLNGIVYGSDHLWYLGMIAGIYALAPVVKEWTDKSDKKSVEYFILVFFLFCILTNTAKDFLQSSLVNKFIDTINLFSVAGYMGYFVLGYYLVKYKIPDKLKVLLIVLLPLDVCINLFVSVWMSRKEQTYSCGIYNSFGLFTFLICVGVFLAFSELFKNRQIGEKTRRLVGNLSKDMLGVYVVHLMILNFLADKGMMEAFNKPEWILLVCLSIFVLSTAVSALLRRIPFVGRYIC